MVLLVVFVVDPATLGWLEDWAFDTHSCWWDFFACWLHNTDKNLYIQIIGGIIFSSYRIDRRTIWIFHSEAFRYVIIGHVILEFFSFHDSFNIFAGLRRFRRCITGRGSFTTSFTRSSCSITWVGTENRLNYSNGSYCFTAQRGQRGRILYINS